MPKNAWSAKRERQYAHIKESLIEGGTRAEETISLSQAGFWLDQMKSSLKYGQSR